MFTAVTPMIELRIATTTRGIQTEVQPIDESRILRGHSMIIRTNIDRNEAP